MIDQSAMQYRKPTFAEIESRVKKLSHVLIASFYIFFAFGGIYLAEKYIHDDVLLELFLSTWWLPSGAAAFFASHAATHWIISYVPDSK